MNAHDPIHHQLEQASEEEQRAILKLGFTSHNIPLGGGRSTLEDKGVVLIGDDPRTLMIRRVLAETGRVPRADPISESVRPRLLDLGALEAGLSFEMVRLGYDVVCVEGRRENIEKCRAVRDYFELETMDVVHADVRAIHPESHGRFDVILCCGLLYHLEKPFSFLSGLHRLLRPGGALFLDTHIAPVDETELHQSSFSGALSPLGPSAEPEASGLIGRRFVEHASVEAAQEEAHPWSSIGNEVSFWPTRDSLLVGLETAGFTAIFDCMGAFPMREEIELRRRHCRLYLLALTDC